MGSRQHPRKCRALCHLLSLILPDRIARRIFLSTPPIFKDGPSESRATYLLDTSGVQQVHRVNSRNKRHETINILPDDILLHIFHFDGLIDVHRLWNLSWYRLVHVCRRWRSIVFASPNFLDLRLLCGPRTRVELIDVWNPLPIVIKNSVDWSMPEDYDFNVAIVHRSRVCEIDLHNLTSSQLRRLASAMQEQFPALIRLTLDYSGYSSHPAPALPDGFLGGSAPHLQFLALKFIPFLALPKLLLSATNLVCLTLVGIPHSGYVSPEAIVTGLAMMAGLKFLTIGFESPLSRPDRKSRRPPTRTVLSALTYFYFRGVSEYSEDLLARIDAPLLDSIKITFFHQLIFDIPQFAQFMWRTTRFQALNEAHVEFDFYGVQVGYLSPTRNFMTGLGISCRHLDWQLSSASQVLTSFFSSILMVERLYIYGPQYFSSRWQDIEDMQWLEIFRPFTAVKSLYLSELFVPRIIPALQELVGGRTTEELPTLQNIFLEGPQSSGHIQEAIENFVAARQLSGHPIAVSVWERDSELEVED